MDDEYQIREGLRSFPWESIGFFPLGIAENGKTALELIIKNPPDVLITDIKMPVMDGLVLSNIIHNEIPECKIIILSGYKDFEYAKSALQSGVYDYLLKPVNHKDLSALFQKLKLELIDEQQKQKRLSDFEQKLKTSILLARDAFFHHLLYGNLTDDVDIKEIMNHLELKMDKHYFSCGIYKIQPEPSTASAFFSPPCQEILKNFFENSELGWFYITQKNELIALFNFDTHSESKSSHLHCIMLAEKLQAYLQDIIEIDNTSNILVGLGNVFQSVHSLQRSFVEARQSLINTSFTSNHTISFSWQENSAQLNESREYPFDKENDLISALFCGTKPLCQKALESFWEKSDLYSSRYDPDYISSVLTQLISSIERRIKDIGVHLSVPVQIEGLQKDIVLRRKSMKELKNSVRDLLFNIMEDTIASMDKSFSPTGLAVTKSKEFIHNNYSQKITLKDAAAHVFLSPSYFSIQFKRDTGLSFVDYLTEFRVQKAKELLRNLELKIYEIGPLVGYENPKYFNDIFKKIENISPNEYRNKFLKTL